METPAANKLARAAHLSEVTGDIVRLSCGNTGFQIEIEAGETDLVVSVCMWDAGDAVIWDGPCEDLAAAAAKIATEIERYDVIISDLVAA